MRKILILLLMFFFVAVGLHAEVGGFFQIYSDYKNQSIDVKRARLEVFERGIYKLTVDFVQSAPVYAAYMDIKLKKNVSLRIGQFKVPFSYEKLVPASAIRTIDKSIINMMVGDYDRGIQISAKQKKVSAAIALFNGEGRTASNIDKRFEYAVRINFNFIGKFGVNLRSKKDETVVGADFQYLRDKLSFSGEAIYFIDSEKYGLYVQPEYYIIPSLFSVVYRYEQGRVDKTTSKNTIGVNIVKGKFKFQFDTIVSSDKDIEYKALTQIKF